MPRVTIVCHSKEELDFYIYIYIYIYIIERKLRRITRIVMFLVMGFLKGQIFLFKLG